MFALGVELLMGRAIITRWDRRDKPEWPPHPDRVFMALVAGCGEPRHEMEQAALEWLESLGPPALAVSEVTSERTVFTSYVPVNDSADPVSKGKPLAPMGSLSIGRNRQPRHFPAVVPDDLTFHLVWPDAELPERLRPAVERVCRNVTYLGHSATPVRVGIAAEHGPITLVPTDRRATHRLRTFGPGRLKDLDERYKAQVRPQPIQWQGYAPPKREPEPLPPSPFDPGLVVLRQLPGDRRFSLESAWMIATALRDTLMQRHGPGAPEWLTGHSAEGPGPSRRPRPAFVPLGFVGREHADGHLLGVGIALPTDFSPDDSRLLFDLLQRPDPHDARQQYDLPEDHPFVELHFRNPSSGEDAGLFAAELDERSFGRREYNLRPETWTGPSCLWATVTPVVLPRYPKKDLTAEQIVAQACVEAGYPAPVVVRTATAPVLTGAPHARSFHRPPKPGRPPKPLLHAVLHFDGPVRGPVLVGAGRYLGLGACRPLPDEDTP